MNNLLTSLLYLVVWLAVLGLLFWLFNWAVSSIPQIPEPVRNVIRVVLVVVFAIACIYLLIGFLPGPGLRGQRLGP